MDFDEELMEQLQKAEAVMKKKEPKVDKKGKGKFFDSATHEMQKPRKDSSGSDKSKEQLKR
jgi:hypothetical protein